MAQNSNQNARSSDSPCAAASLNYQRPGAKQAQASQKLSGERSHKKNVCRGHQSTVLPQVCPSQNSVASSRSSSRTESLQSIRSLYGMGRNCVPRTQIRPTAFGRPARMGAPQIRHGVLPARKSSSRQLHLQENVPAQHRTVQLPPGISDNACQEKMEYPRNEPQLGARYHPSRLPEQPIPSRLQPTYSFTQPMTSEVRGAPRIAQRPPAVPCTCTRMTPPGQQVMQSPCMDKACRVNMHPTMQPGTPQQSPYDIRYDSRQRPQSPPLDVSYRSNAHPTVQICPPQQVSRTQMPYDVCYDSRQGPQSQTSDKSFRSNAHPAIKGNAPQQGPRSPMQFSTPQSQRTLCGSTGNRPPQSVVKPCDCQKNATDATPPTPTQVSTQAPTLEPKQACTQAPTQTTALALSSTIKSPIDEKIDESIDQCKGDVEKDDPNQAMTTSKQSKICERRALLLCPKKEESFLKRFLNKLWSVFDYFNSFLCIRKTPAPPPEYYELMKTGQGACPQLQQLYGLHNLFTTKDLSLANLPESIRECAAAKKCGLMPTDKFDTCGADSSSRQAHINTLATDTYCPGIIQEAVDGTENFYAVAFNMVDMDLKQKPGEKPINEPVSLLEAFDERINMEREALRLKVSADAPKQQILEAVQRFFNEKHNPTDLNRSIGTFLMLELLEDNDVVEESKQRDHPFKADVLKYFTLTPDNLGIKHVIYLGTTRFGASKPNTNIESCDENEEDCPPGTIAVLSNFTRRLADTLVGNKLNYHKL